MTKKKVIVGLSGGVDSATSSYLIQKESKGYNISAVFMQNWDDLLAGNKSAKKRCAQTQDWKDALEVAKFLGIKVERISFINEYWEKVFLDFISKLKKGMTPNPDILCNKLIKFAHFFNYARQELGADYVVTGHYARIIFNEKNQNYYLAKCEDQNKDQTYFLCNIDKKVLPYLIFPLSNLKKEKVRAIAKMKGIPTFQKKDSTGICFIGENNFSSFIRNYLDEKQGEIINIDTFEVIGTHSGAFFYTIGQRKGLGLSGSKVAYYVVAKDISKNLLYVANGCKNEWLYSDKCIVKDVNWLIDYQELEETSTKEIKAKFRHRQEEKKVKIKFLRNRHELEVSFEEPLRAITPGQYAVFYQKNICLGGGIISSTEKLNSCSNPLFS